MADAVYLVRAVKDAVALTANITVSTLTPLIAYTLLSGYDYLLFYAINTGAVATTVTLETSEDGTYTDGVATQSKACAAGAQVSFELGILLRRYWRLSAQTASGSTTMKACIRGSVRLGGT